MFSTSGKRRRSQSQCTSAASPHSRLENPAKPLIASQNATWNFSSQGAEVRINQPQDIRDIWGAGTDDHSHVRNDISSRQSKPGYSSSYTSLQSNITPSKSLTPTLATSATDFDLHPGSETLLGRHCKRSRQYQSPQMDMQPSKSMPVNLEENLVEANHTRTKAFYALQQSIMDSGEGFLRKFRRFEEDRFAGHSSQLSGAFSGNRTKAKAKEAQRKGRKRALLVRNRHRNAAVACSQADMEESDEDEILIIGGDCNVRSQSSPPACKRNPRIQDIRTSLKPEWNPQLYPGGNLDVAMNSTTSLATSHSSSRSMDSSLSPFYSCTSPASSPSISSTNLPSSSIASIPASHSEKALAALTLALANGAGGLDDYSAAAELVHPHSSPSEEDQDFGFVGQMWD